MGSVQSKAYLSLLCCAFALNVCFYSPFLSPPKPRRCTFTTILYWSGIICPRPQVAELKIELRFHSRIWASFSDDVDVEYMEDPNLTSRDPQNQACTSGKKEPMPCRVSLNIYLSWIKFSFRQNSSSRQGSPSAWGLSYNLALNCLLSCTVVSSVYLPKDPFPSLSRPSLVPLADVDMSLPAGFSQFTGEENQRPSNLRAFWSFKNAA